MCAGVPESEVVTVALVSGKYFASTRRMALTIMQPLQDVSGSINRSRLRRCLHRLYDEMMYLPELLSDMLSTPRM